MAKRGERIRPKTYIHKMMERKRAKIQLNGNFFSKNYFIRGSVWHIWTKLELLKTNHKNHCKVWGNMAFQR